MMDKKEGARGEDNKRWMRSVANDPASTITGAEGREYAVHHYCARQERNRLVCRCPLRALPALILTEDDAWGCPDAEAPLAITVTRALCNYEARSAPSEAPARPMEQNFFQRWASMIGSLRSVHLARSARSSSASP